MAKSPILPGNDADPTGVDRLERGAMREMRRRIGLIRGRYIEALNSIPAEPAVNRRYTYQLYSYTLETLLADLDAFVDSILLEGGREGLWFAEAYVRTGYQRGTAQEFANLGQQSPAYAAGRQGLQQLLASEPYRRRVALVRARAFEEMQGLSGNVKANMTRVLTDGVARGLNPREVARNLRGQAGIEVRRADRIARTEITNALRRARWDEHDDASEQYGLRSMLMHYSALSPTTRITHASRHANLYTSDQIRDWYAVDGNSINCKCSQLSVLVDDSGQPLVPAIVERAKRNKQVMRERGEGPWTDED